MATVLVTGTNRGIGLEFVEQLAARGDRVLATCRCIREATKLQLLDEKYDAVQLFEMDVADIESMKGFAAEIESEAIDIFINNAGVYGPKTVQFGNVDSSTWASVLQINTIAPLILTQLLINNFRRGVDHKLLYLSSKVGSIADNQGGGGYMYRSSKTALNQVVKSLSVDLAGDDLMAAALHPGWVLTDMGGPNALIDTHTSVSGLLEVIDGLSMEQSGSFLNYDGSIIPW